MQQNTPRAACSAFSGDPQCHESGDEYGEKEKNWLVSAVYGTVIDYFYNYCALSVFYRHLLCFFPMEWNWRNADGL